MTERVGERQRPQRAHRVHEQRMGAVERVDESASGNARPPARLDGAADFQRQLIEMDFPGRGVEAALEGEPPQVPVRAHVVEAMVVHADVADVRGHPLERPGASQLEPLPFAGGVELQNRRSELKALGPFRPPTRDVSAADGEHRGAGAGRPRRLNRGNLRGGEGKQAVDLGREVLGAVGRRRCASWSDSGSDIFTSARGPTPALGPRRLATRVSASSAGRSYMIA